MDPLVNVDYGIHRLAMLFYIGVARVSDPSAIDYKLVFMYTRFHFHGDRPGIAFVFHTILPVVPEIERTRQHHFPRIGIPRKHKRHLAKFRRLRRSMISASASDTYCIAAISESAIKRNRPNIVISI